MPRRSLADKPISPWREALADTSIFPIGMAVMVAFWRWPGGDLVLLATATLFGLAGLVAFPQALRLHRRRLASQQEQARHSETLARRLSLRQDDSFSLE